METKHNAVSHPSHYAEGRKFEPKDVIRDWGLNFNLGNAVKYLARAGRKDDIIQDLKKAQQYIQFEIDAIEAERKNAVKPTGAELKAPQHPNCRCSVMTMSKADVIKLVVPMGTPRDQLIKMFIDKMYEVE